ncbi:MULTISPECIES: hypothetical protein [unclassified Spirosoma]|uniref:hypothetical protein n=1 Tax=unclassified Spirosoma TaxID=2621999 RepID=UPI000959E694|nr:MULTISPECIES: hypothetical protein [unclassified Spirosoma]MBN8826305.1 hypothetical protein [Spirosoma sp.]OJW75203.1 MAG: hypothetical protein BGO59_18090 [Spirosoma sp. 48-14]
MFPAQIALISLTTKVSLSRLAVVSAALQKQVTRDFSPIWKIQATVSVFQKLDDVPPGYWPIIIVNKINAGVPGIHLDAQGQPFALILANNDVPLTCSHELLEMLVDPFSDRFVASNSLIPEQGRVNYLVEICDPCQDVQFGYPVNGLVLSDFYTPQYFDPVAAPGVRYSFHGTITQPRQIREEGYLSWRTFSTGEWFQASFFDGKQKIENLGRLQKDSRGWREIIDELTARPRRQAKLVAPAIDTICPSQAIRDASTAWASALKDQIAAFID